MKKYKYEFSIIIKGGEPIDISITSTNDVEAWSKISFILNHQAYLRCNMQTKEEVEF